MCWTLCRTTCACAWRPLRSALRANPLIAALCVVAAICAPLLALAGGRAVSPAIDAASADAALARAFAFAIVAGAGSVGVVFASLAPSGDLLGAALSSAPVRRRTIFLGVTLLPTTVLAAPLLVLLAAFVVPATSGVGAWSAPGVVAGICGGFACGAACAEAALLAIRRPGIGALVASALVAAWGATGAAGGSLILGPAAVISDALSTPTALDAAVLATTFVLAVVLWAVASVLRPEGRSSSGVVRVPVRMPRGAMRGTATATLVRLGRDAQVRRHVVTGCSLAFGGALALRVTVGDAAPFLAAFVAVVLASAIPLVAAGLRRELAWLVRAAPVSRARSALADAGASVLGGYTVAIVVLAAVAPLAALGAGELLLLEATLALVLGAAAATGAVLPWRSDRVLDQLGSYAVLTAVTVALSVVLGRAVDAAPTFGLADTQLAALVAHAVLVAGVAIAGALES